MTAALDDFLWTYQHLVHAIGINGLMALSMYVVMAAGQLSLGQAAFMGLGAYTGTLLTLSTELPFAAVLLLACLVPVAFALVIGGPSPALTRGPGRSFESSSPPGRRTIGPSLR